jgi:hypothetical protein
VARDGNSSKFTLRSPPGRPARRIPQRSSASMMGMTRCGTGGGSVSGEAERRQLTRASTWRPAGPSSSQHAGSGTPQFRLFKLSRLDWTIENVRGSGANISETACYHFATQLGSTTQGRKVVPPRRIPPTIQHIAIPAGTEYYVIDVFGFDASERRANVRSCDAGMLRSLSRSSA